MRTAPWRSIARPRRVSVSTSPPGLRSASSRARPARSSPWPCAAVGSSLAYKWGSRMVEISRSRYAALYGPTTGDEVRLADTDLWIQVEDDLTVGGEEAVFGGGKSIRESMAQGSTTRAAGAPDTVITNALILDWWGIVK